MINQTKFVGCIAGFLGLVGSSFAQLNGDFTPDLSSVDIPAFNGATFSETISATSVSFDFSQGLTSNRLTAAGTISASDVFDNGSIVVDSIGGNINFSASLALRGRIVSLAGAKATLAGVTGSGSAVVSGRSYGVDVTAVTGAFTIRNMIINLDSEEISGVIVRGSLRISGRATDYPNIRRTVVAPYSQEALGPSAFSGDIINPSFVLSLATNPNGRITGTATGTFGNYDDIAFNVTRGQFNARSGISTITLASTGGVRGVSATLNLDAEGNPVSRPKSALQVLGYRLQFP